MNLKEKVKNLTTAPGVYLMKDSLDSIIYVGKAKNLKKRVQSYFRDSKSHSPKVEKLKKNLKDFEYIITDTEFEALILECKLIKQLKPIYNRIMKNPLSYTYIVARKDEEYPSIDIAHSPLEGNGIYFGPYANKNTVEKAVLGFKKCYRIPCSDPFRKSAPCLNSSLGLCIGICLGGHVIEYYNNMIDKLIALLDGTNSGILEEMNEKMSHAAEKLDFETAALYKGYIDAMNSLISRENVVKFTGSNNNIVLIDQFGEGIIKLFLIKRNKVLYSERYIQDSMSMEKLCEVIKNHIMRYFKDEIHDIPNRVTKDEIDEAHIIYRYLKSSANKYAVIPQQWLDNNNENNIDEALYTLVNT